MDWQARIRQAFATATSVPDADVLEELSQHAQAVHDALRREGWSVAEADRRIEDLMAAWVADATALRRLPTRPPTVTPPPSWPESKFSGLAQDARYALRVLWRQPRFAALVVLTMALGIGATTTLFSVTYGVLMKPLPWPEAERLVLLKETRGGRAPRFGSFSSAAYAAWRDQTQAVAEIGAWTRRTATLTGAGDPVRIRIAAVTASLFRALGVRATTGSLFDDRDEARPLIVISEGLWRQRFGGDDQVIGRSIQLDGEPRTIVGVLADAFAYPDRQTRAWIPFRVPQPTGNALSMFEAICKLRPGATPEQAAAEGTARGQFAVESGLTTTAIFGGTGPIEVNVRSFAEALTADVRRPLMVLLAAVGCLLGIAAANVASLQLARTAARRRELAIRASIGASGSRLVRQLVVESLALGVVGGAGGLVLSWLLHRTAVTILPADFPRLAEIAIDWPVIVFAALVSIASSVVFGLLPALRLRRLDLVGILAGDGTSPAGTTRDALAGRTRLLIVTTQIAVACVLLVAALLLGRSFIAQLQADRGYDPVGVLSAPLSIPSPAYTPLRRGETLGEIIARLTRIPGVRAAAFSTELPITPGGSTSAFTMPARTAEGGTVTVQASPRIVSPEYFRALDLRIVAGRSLAETDTATSEPVCIVNQTFQQRYLGADAVGAKVPMALWGQNQDGEATIVGVTEDVRYIGSSTTSLPELYFSYRQLKVGVRPTTSTLLVRTDRDPRGFAESVRSAVSAIDPALVPETMMTLEDRLLASSLARPRLYAALVGSFALLALLVTAVGLFGVLSYTVSQRTRELGIRAALGASRWHLVRLVLSQGLAVAAAGTAIGLVASVWLMRFISTLLFGVTPTDAVTHVAVPVLLLGVSLLACVVPARRAAKLDPLKALRS